MSGILEMIDVLQSSLQQYESAISSLEASKRDAQQRERINDTTRRELQFSYSHLSNQSLGAGSSLDKILLTFLSTSHLALTESLRAKTSPHD